MITVLHVIDSLGTGGAEHQLTDLLLRSDRSQFRHIVCTTAPPARFAEDLRRGGIEVTSLNLRSKYDFFNGLLRLRATALRTQAQIIHCSLVSASAIARPVGRLLRIPVVTTLTDTTYEPEWWMDNPHLVAWKVAILKGVDGFTARRWGRHFIAISEAVKASTVRQLSIPRERISVIYRGFPFDRMPPEAPRSRRRSSGAVYPTILSVGRLVAQKGHCYLIEAMPRVVQAFPQARLLIAGEGWLRPRLEAMIEACGVQHVVTLLGERHDVDALLREADIFAFPSLHEGFGVALLEAMAAGRACVASDLPVLREVTGQGATALLVPSRSPAALAEGIITLAGDVRLSAELGAAAAQWVREQYDLRRSLGAHAALYHALVDGAVRHPGSVSTATPTA